MADLYTMWSQARDRGEQRAADQIVRQNLQPALGGDANALATIFSKSPDTGLKVQGLAADQRKAQADEFGKLSAAYVSSKNPQIYSQWRQRGVSLGFLPAETPESMTDPADLTGSLQAAQAFAQAYGGAQDSTPSAIRELQMLQANPDLAALDMKRRTAGFGRPQLYTDANGNVSWITPPQAGGIGGMDSHPQQEAVIAEANRMAAAGLPSDQIDAWVQEQLSQPVTVSAPGVTPIPGLRGKTPAADKPSELERRIAMARQFGASDDDIRRMVIGREGAAAGAKPLPVGALKELLDVQDAIAGTQNVSAIIKKHADRMASGGLEVRPENAIGARVRTTFGMSNPNDVNLNEFNADKTRIVNESLRLNKGVQTEGDAQRATQELMAANDQATAARALRRLAEINNRAVQLQRQKQALIRRNYGQDAGGNPASSADAPRSNAIPASPGGWSIKVKP